MLSRLVAPVLALVSLSMFVGCASGGDDASASASAIESTLAPSAYADLVVLDASFPFAVTARHATTQKTAGARWGAHNGPEVTLAGDPGAVVHFDGDGVAQANLSAAKPAGLPLTHFWDVDGFVDVPSASLAFRAYTTATTPFAGELFFYDAGYANVKGRVAVNGFYSGTGITNGRGSRIVYSGLSGLGARSTAPADSGLYAADLCADGTACNGSTRLFGWDGLSGPVAADADGNVFVSAFESDTGHTDVVYGATVRDAFASSGISPTVLGGLDTNGTESLVAAGKGGKGWLLGKGYDANQPAPVWAQAYESTGTSLHVVGGVQKAAITAASGDVSLTLFADGQGKLWIGADSDKGSAFLELAAK